MAITLYCDENDLERFALGAQLLADPEVTVDMIADAIEAASREADGYLDAQYTLPLEQIGVDLSKHVAWIAGYTIMTAIGFSPEAGQDNLYERNYDKAIAWLKLVRGGLRPSGVIGATTATPETGQAAGGRPMVIAGSSRGYSNRGGGPDVVFDLGTRYRGGGNFTGD